MAKKRNNKKKRQQSNTEQTPEIEETTYHTARTVEDEELEITEIKSPIPNDAEKAAPEDIEKINGSKDGSETTSETKNNTKESSSSEPKTVSPEPKTVSPEPKSSSSTLISRTSSVGSPLPDNIKFNATWTIWFDHPKLAPAGSDWKQNLKQMGTFNTCEGFWRVFNNLKPAQSLSASSNYSVFRVGIEPAWEDPENIEGGKFIVTLGKKESRTGKCNEFWLFTVLAIVGETMDATGDQVNGAVVSIRKHEDRISLWLKNSDPDICVRIGERWKKVLRLEKTTLKFVSHQTAAKTGRSFRNEAQFEV